MKHISGRNSAVRVQQSYRNSSYMEPETVRNGCGCNTYTENTTRQIEPPPCSSNVQTKTWPFTLKNELGTQRLSSEKTYETKELPQMITKAHLFEFTMEKREPTQEITEEEVIEALPHMWLTDGDRNIIPQEINKYFYIKYLKQIGYNLKIVQTKRLHGGLGDENKAVVKVMFPFIYARMVPKGSIFNTLTKSDTAFTPHSRPILHIENEGDTNLLFNRSFKLTCVYSPEMPKYEKIFKCSHDITIDGSGLNCIRMPDNGCIEAIIWQPQWTIIDGSMQTVKNFKLKQNEREIITNENFLTWDLSDFAINEDCAEHKWYYMNFHTSEYCCNDGCLGVDCTSKLEIESGYAGRSELKLTYVMLVQPNLNTPCCC